MTAILIVLGIILLICLANSGSEKPKMTKAEVERELLWKMQHCSSEEVIKFYNDHTDYDLKNYPPFKSWYKHFIDFAFEAGIIRLKGGGKYDPNEDHLYDPNAADWYDTYAIHYDEDEDDDEEEDLVAKVLEQRRIEKMTIFEESDYRYKKRLEESDIFKNK